MQEPELLLSLDDEFDLNFDDLSCFISPKNANTPANGSVNSEDTLARQEKISPLVTNELLLEVAQPAISSVRGYDINNNPVFSSSQTPHDFQTMTKRKTSKKSIFNFEDVDISHGNKTNQLPKHGQETNFGVSNVDECPRGMDMNHILPTQNSQQSNPLDRTIRYSKNPRKKQTSKFDSFDSVSADFDHEFSNVPVEHVEIDTAPLLCNSDGMSLNSSANWGNSSCSSLPYTSNYSSPAMTLPSISNALGSSTSNYLLSDLPPIPAESLLNISHGSTEAVNLNSVDYQHYLQLKVQNLQLNPNISPADTACVNISEDFFERSFAPTIEDDTTSKATIQNGGKDPNSTVNNRASKSLTEISRRFVLIYGKDNTLDYISGIVDPKQYSEPYNSFNRVDAAAETLNVHVRRIYELIKILEILSLVAFAGDKRGKFSWRGTKRFLYTLGCIQNEGIKKFPLLAAQMGLDSSERQTNSDEKNLYAEEEHTKLNEFSFIDNDTLDFLSSFDKDDDASKNPHANYSKKNPAVTPAAHEEAFMVEVICKRFLQLFLVGMNTLSMSTAIQKLIPMEDQQSIADYNKLNATKIRRVYDVTNVLCSLNLIRKKSVPKLKALKAEVYNSIDSSSAYESAKRAVTEFEVEQLNKPKKSGAKASGDRSDTKVLEWSSFSPQIIRQHYLQSTANNYCN